MYWLPRLSRRFATSGAAILAVLLNSCGKPVPKSTRRDRTVDTFASVCATCHGAKGEGNAQLKAPSIASLPEWYVREQLTKFRTGMRGVHAKDTAGQ